MSKPVLAAIAVAIFLPVACGAYTVYNSVVSAPSRVINKTLETNNIIFNYERFFDVNATFESRKAQVVQYKKILSEETDKEEKISLRTELAAMQQSCRELSQSYNADSAKLNRALFKDRNLPYQLNSQECE